MRREITVKDTGSGGCSHPSAQAHTLWIPPPLAPGLLACPGFIAGVVHFRLTSGSQSLLLDSRQTCRNSARRDELRLPGRLLPRKCTDSLICNET